MTGGVILLFLAIQTIVGLVIGWKVKDRAFAGFMLGLFLGVIGWVIIALLPPSRGMKVAREAERQRIAEEARAQAYARQYPWHAPSQQPRLPEAQDPADHQPPADGDDTLRQAYGG